MTDRIRTILSGAAACTVLASIALAAPAAREPVAIVQDATASVEGAVPMDLLRAGARFRLQPSETITLGYLKSCIEETITGGEVVVGAAQSDVLGGRIDRRKVECDGGRMRLDVAHAQNSGVGTFRSGGTPVIKIYGASPVFLGEPGRRVEIRPVDGSTAPLGFDLGAAAAGRRAALDLANRHVALVPGQRYQVTSHTSVIIVEIDAAAKPGPGPLLGRLVRL